MSWAVCDDAKKPPDLLKSLVSRAFAWLVAWLSVGGWFPGRGPTFMSGPFRSVSICHRLYSCVALSGWIVLLRLGSVGGQ